MKPSLTLFSAVFFLLVLWSCGDLTKEAERRLEQLQSKTESLDSMINQEVNKVMTLDSLVNVESEKVKKLDSLINDSSSKLDSLSNGKIQLLKKIIN
jgi:copper homeostasis protein CutC